MIEFVEWFCLECGGRCCMKFPAYQFLRDNKIMTPAYSKVGTRNTTLHLYFRKKDYQSMECFYHEIGGCPDIVKPDACRYFVCQRFDNFILGLGWEQQRQSNHPKESTLRLYKALT